MSQLPIRQSSTSITSITVTSGLVLAFLIACTIAGCVKPKIQVERKFSLGTNGNLLAALDSQNRVREFRQFNPDQSLKLKVGLIYAERDIQQLLVFDSQGRKVWESTFAAGSISGSGRNSDLSSPGWEIRMQSDWSGRLGDIHDTVSWYCEDDLLYRVHRTWPDDRSRVRYEITGPSGVILFTNTYIER